MTHTAVLRFAPAYDTRHLVDDPAGAPALMVESGALQKVKREELTPVLVDHDDDRVVGHVRDVWVHDDVDYGTRVRRWWFASVDLTDPPSWLKRGGGVSWGYKPLHTYDAAGTTVLTRCLFDEVSILSPATAPAEPLARVCLVKRSSAARAPSAARAAVSAPASYAAAQVIHHPAPSLRRAPSLDEQLLEWIRDAPDGLDERTYGKILALLAESRLGPSIHDIYREHFGVAA